MRPHTMLTGRSAVAGCLLAIMAFGQRTAAAEPDWRPLFDGRSLDGWRVWIDGPTAGADPERIVQVRDGAIHLYSDAIDGVEAPFGYVTTEEEFSDYRLRFEYRWGKKRFAPRAAAKRDSGVLYHFVGPDRIWPRSVECQIQEGDTGDVWFVDGASATTTLAPGAGPPTYDPAGAVAARTGERLVKASTEDRLNGWNRVEIVVHGDSFVHIVNGVVVARGVQMRRPDPDHAGRSLPLDRGRIALQAEGAEVEFRNVEIAEIDSRAPHDAELPSRLANVEAGDAIGTLADDQGVFQLFGAGARLTGSSVRVDPFKAVAAYWGSPRDEARWTLRDANAGRYEVHVAWAVSDADADQPFELLVDGELALTARFPSTGNYETFDLQAFGTLHLSAGDHELVLRPKADVRGDLADIRRVVLVPEGMELAVAEQSSQSMSRNDGPRLEVPEGFVVECVAAPPLVEHPMLACFDDEGRLYVAESAGVNHRGDRLLDERPHSIRVLTDTDGDGRFDASQTFADRLVFPQGVVWRGGWLYVASPPSFWRMRDTDGDLVADEREELITGFANTGVADDLHGGSLGPDGRVYWVCGRFPHDIRRPDGPILRHGRAPLLLRCRPDGTDFEVVGGVLGNPAGADFTPEGEPIVSGTFLDEDSAGPGFRDGLVYCIDGGEYSVRGLQLNEHKRTGELLPALAHLGVSASSDLTFYHGDQFGVEYHGALFSALFNMHKIMRHTLERDGATFTCRNQDFLVSADEDFHPTDVFEDADGSLLVIDTGGWFVIGCPTSRLAKPEVTGAIYRVRREGAVGPDDPRGLNLNWDEMSPAELVSLLDDGRFAVRQRAMLVLEQRGDDAVESLDAALDSSSIQLRRNAVWTLARIGGPVALSAVRQALHDPHDSIRQTAARAAGIERDAAAAEALAECLSDASLAVRREAATALGRLRDSRSVPSLLAALASNNDRFSEHAILFALIEINDPRQTEAGLADPRPQVRRGALIALDQMDAGDLQREQAARMLDTADEALQRTALEVIARRPGWADETTALLERWFAADELDMDRSGIVRGVLAAFDDSARVQNQVALALASDSSSKDVRKLLLEAIGQFDGDTLPEAWREQLARHLNIDEPSVRSAALAAVAARGPAGFESELAEVARDEHGDIADRAAAAAVLAKSDAVLDDDMFGLLQQRLGEDVAPAERLAAARAIGGARLSGPQVLAVVDRIDRCGPLELPLLAAVFESPQAAPHGERIVAALEQSPGLVSLAPDRFEAILANLSDSARAAAAPLRQRFADARAEQTARLTELAASISSGNASRGRDVFYSSRASCSACHRVGGDGGAVGPNLTAIGAIRTQRDLLEAIVYPSASFARGYEPFTLVTESGLVHSGVIGRETPDAIWLRTNDRAELRVMRDEIDDIQPASVSIMPQGLDRTLTAEELADLIAFLSSQKQTGQ